MKELVVRYACLLGLGGLVVGTAFLSGATTEEALDWRQPALGSLALVSVAMAGADVLYFTQKPQKHPSYKAPAEQSQPPINYASAEEYQALLEKQMGA